MATPLGPGLQLDLLTVVLRLEQIERGDEWLLDRVLTCDLPRLRGHLTEQALVWKTEVDGATT